MARKARFERTGGLYHVINRGSYRSWIFESDGAKKSFEKALLEAAKRSGWILHAYCVMGNHFHLALETPEPNLSEGMRWLQSSFATRFNRFRKENGHVFQGRFKSLVVEDSERLERCLEALGKDRSDVEGDMKSANWKIAVASHLKKTLLCRNGRLADRLGMGTESAVARYCSEFFRGETSRAAKGYQTLITKVLD